MLAIIKRGGQYRPAIVCDACGDVITDALAATVVSSNAPEGTSAQAFHVHKGTCDQALASRVAGLHGSDELASHLLDLVGNTLRDSDRDVVRSLVEQFARDG